MPLIRTARIAWTTLPAALSFIVSVAYGPVASFTARGNQDSPREYIDTFTGRTAIDCGEHGIGADETALRASLNCALNASRRREAFHTVRQLQGTDSLVYDGLLGKPDGTIYLFSYDSAPCGGPGCPGRFVIGRCAQPGMRVDGSRIGFSCSP